MSDRAPDRRWTLAPSTDGGWALDTGDPETAIETRREPSTRSWLAAGPTGRRSQIVETSPAGFAARSEVGDELARSSAPRGLEGDTRLRHLSMADGRLFRIVRGASDAGRFVLLGWETSGSYLEARRTARGWDVLRTPAGRAVENLETAALLFCMEIVDASEASRTEET